LFPEHRDGVIEGLAKRYGVKTLVERDADIRKAIQRDKNMNHRSRAEG
jgi:predicted GIY-YIG superfamily endonuclease